LTRVGAGAFGSSKHLKKKGNMTEPTSISEPGASPYPTFSKIRAAFGWKFRRWCLLGLAIVTTLVALFYAVENMRGKRAWERYRAEQEAKGVKFDLLAHVPAPVPDDQNFAMTPFLRPLYDFEPGTQQHRDTNGFLKLQQFGRDLRAEGVKLANWRTGGRIDLAGWLQKEQSIWLTGQAGAGEAAKTNVLSQAQAAQLALEYLQQFDKVVEEIRTASRRPQARYNIYYQNENPAGILLPHLAVIRKLCQILEMRASAELALGQADQAHADLQLVLYLAGTLRDEPIVISQLVRYVCLEGTWQVLWEGLAGHQWSEPQLRDIMGRLERLNLVADNLRAMNVGERIGMGHGVFEFVRRDPARLSSLMDATQETSESPGNWPWLRLVPTGWLYLEEVNFHQIFESFALPGVDPVEMRVQPGLIRQNGDRLVSTVKVGPLDAVLGHKVMSAILLPALVRIHQRGAGGQVSVDEARVACALELHRRKSGAFPNALDELSSPSFKPPTDVIGGQPLRYQRGSDGGYVLYSVGWNEKDDGGLAATNSAGHYDADNGDWVWRLPGK
jgi:hypothetical protein